MGAWRGSLVGSAKLGRTSLLATLHINHHLLESRAWDSPRERLAVNRLRSLGPQGNQSVSGIRTQELRARLDFDALDHSTTYL